MHLIRWYHKPFAAALLLLVAACGGSENPQEGNQGGPGEGTTPAVEVIQARNGSLPLQERLSGTVRAQNQVAIFPEIAAPVVQVAAQNGDYVRQGQPLVYLRDTQFRDQLRQAEATLQINTAEAKRTEATMRELKGRLDRTKELAEKQLQSQQALETLQAQYDGAEATHEQALGRIAQAEASISEQQEALRRAVVRAPINGIVGQRQVEVGMRVDTGSPLFIIGCRSSSSLIVSVPRVDGRAPPFSPAICASRYSCSCFGAVV
jgi:RND family efflux transporter MFP subunit